jgi:hypothetical protein
MKTGINEKLCESQYQYVGSYPYFCTKSMDPTIGG